MKISKKGKIFIPIFTTAILSICLAGVLIAYIPSKMSEKHTDAIAELYFEDTGYDIEAFTEKWRIQTFEITSDLGHRIPVYYIAPNCNYDNKTVVLVHWHESNHVVMYPIAELFLDKGWNVVLYDQRAHGKNTAETVTFGYLESSDLRQVVAFTKDKAGNNAVGVLGQSMGAATIGYYLGSKEAQENLTFAIMDSPYSGMYDEVAWEISKGKVPLLANVVTSIGSIFCKTLYGYYFEDVSVVDKIKNSYTPTLIMHSKADQKCPYFMSEEIFDAIPHDKKVFVRFKNSEHIFSFWDESKQYSNELFHFINNVLYPTE